MRYGIDMVPLGPYADPRPVVELAVAAEACGWEAFFVWDHHAFVWGVASGDPWVMLAAVAQATTKLKIGTDVTPLPRRRPHGVAHALATLDLLSNGRVILGAGLGGVEAELAAFGEVTDAKERAAMLDEGLTLVDGLLRGETVTHAGPHYTANGVTLAPRPVQQPRPPIWIGGDSRPAQRRAARWDGWVIGSADETATMTRSPDQLSGEVAYIRQHRAATAPFDVAVTGVSDAGKTEHIAAFAAAGATWWLESLYGLRADFDGLMARIRAGPPRVDASFRSA
jgi:alkanesulfonate monooxygenase SsuD/methylene tetrahydromethanopterin reductase-like flavin-dependent oxidoreductase (luciferase family)